MFTHKFLECFDYTLQEMIKDKNLISAIDVMSMAISEVRARGGRLFILGVGGSAGNASHAVNDFRKLCGIEAYAPTDNVSELTALINDEGWNTSLVTWLTESKLNEKDGVLILSVGGGSIERQLSMNLIYASAFAKDIGAKVLAIVGKKGGEIGKMANYKVVVPEIYPELVTPITEAMQSVLLHLLVSHDNLISKKPTW